jgi:hypothetical protein
MYLTASSIVEPPRWMMVGLDGYWIESLLL